MLCAAAYHHHQVMLALKPPPGTVYGSSRHGSNGSSSAKLACSSREGSVHSGSPIGVFGSPVPPRFEQDPPLAFDAPPSTRTWDAAVGGGLMSLGAGLQSLGARVSSSGNLALSRSSSFARLQRVSEEGGDDAAAAGGPSSAEQPAEHHDSRDSSPTSTHYRAFEDSQRSHAADWASGASLSVLVRTTSLPPGAAWQPPSLPRTTSPLSSDDGQASASPAT